MTQPSRGAAAFLTLFGLPFLGAGLAFIYKQLVGNGNHTTFETVASILFGSVFVFIGGGHIRGRARLRTPDQAGCARGSESAFSLAVANRLGFAPRRKSEQEKRRHPLGSRRPLQCGYSAISPRHDSGVPAQPK